MSTYSSFTSISNYFDAIAVDEKDSASFNMKDWNTLANTISDKYNDYQSFVVVHGLPNLPFIILLVF